VGVSAGHTEWACVALRCSSGRWRSAWSAGERAAACSTSPAVTTRMYCAASASMVRLVSPPLASRPDPASLPVTSGPGPSKRRPDSCNGFARDGLSATVGQSSERAHVDRGRSLPVGDRLLGYLSWLSPSHMLIIQTTPRTAPKLVTFLTSAAVGNEFAVFSCDGHSPVDRASSVAPRSLPHC
jgi:hypothetical protein